MDLGLKSRVAIVTGSSQGIGKAIATGLSEEGAKTLQLSMMSDTGEFARILLRMKWVVFHNRTPWPFWTSDSPVARHNPIHTRSRGNLGLRSRGIEVHYPLSPRVLLCIIDPLLNRPLADRYELDDRQFVVFENSVQLSNATRYVFSNTGDFNLVGL